MNVGRIVARISTTRLHSRSFVRAERYERPLVLDRESGGPMRFQRSSNLGS